MVNIRDVPDTYDGGKGSGGQEPWKMIKAAICGYSEGDAQADGAAYCNPQSLFDAADAFLHAQAVFTLMQEVFDKHAKGIAGKDKVWQGPAAEAFVAHMDTYSKIMRAHVQTITNWSGKNQAADPEGGRRGIPAGLIEAGRNLDWAQKTVEAIDVFHAGQATRAGAGNNSNGTVTVSSKPEIVKLLNEDMNKVFTKLSGLHTENAQRHYTPPTAGPPPPLGSQNNPYGNNPYGNNPYGNNPYDNNPYGNNPYGDYPGGNYPGGNQPGGYQPGDYPGGNYPDGDYPGGDNPGGNYPGGDYPGGNYPGGNYPGGNYPGGNYPGGDNPGGQYAGANYPGGDFPGGGDYPGGSGSGAGNFPGADYKGAGSDFGPTPWDGDGYDPTTANTGLRSYDGSSLDGVTTAPTGIGDGLGPYSGGGYGGAGGGAGFKPGSFDGAGGGGFGGAGGGFGGAGGGLGGGIGSGLAGGAGGGLGSALGGLGGGRAGGGSGTGSGPGSLGAGGGAGGSGRGAGTGPGGMMPGAHGGAGQGAGQGEQERERTTWLIEDAEVWGAEPDLPPDVIGR